MAKSRVTDSRPLLRKSCETAKAKLSSRSAKTKPSAVKAAASKGGKVHLHACNAAGRCAMSE